MDTSVELSGLGADIPIGYDAAAGARDVAGHVRGVDQLKAHVRAGLAHMVLFHVATRVDERWDRLYRACDAWDDADRIDDLVQAVEDVVVQLKACGKNMVELVGEANVVSGSLQLAVASFLIGVVKRAVKRRVKELGGSQTT